MKKNTFKNNLPWGLMTFFAVAVTIVAVAPYVTLNSANFNNATTRYATEIPIRYVSLFIHAFSSGIALLLGPFQFLNRLRQRRPVLHRWLGRIYLTGILVGGLSAFVIAPGIISGLVGQVGLSLLGVLWLWTGWNAYSTIRAGQVTLHREWMIRNFGLTFAAVTLRLWLGILIGTQVPLLDVKYGGDFDALFVEAYRVVMWLCWVPNLIIAEWIIQRRRMAPVQTQQNEKLAQA